MKVTVKKTGTGDSITAHLILGVVSLVLAGGLAFWVEDSSRSASIPLPVMPRESRVHIQKEARTDPRSPIGAASQVAGTHSRASDRDFSFVVTQLPVTQKPEVSAATGGMLRAAYGEGGRVLLVTPNGGRKVLSAGFASAADPDISFDGQRILFAGKKLETDNWQIFEMKADGSETRQVTKDPGNCRGPTYQSKLNTLVADEPWYQITFVSTAAGELNEFGAILSTNLYSSKLDGTFVSRLTFNPSSSFDPFLNDDGRLIFAMWQRGRLDRGELGRIGLFELHLDGTDLMLLSANQGRRIKHMPTVTTDGWVVFVEADEVGWDGGGLLAAVSLRRRLTSYRQITRLADGLFHSPSPLPNGKILVSRRTVGTTSNYGVYRLDPKTGRYDLVFDDPNYHDIQAKVLAPRLEPDGRSSSVFVATGDIDDPTSKQSFIPKNPRGKLYCLNAYISDLDRSQWLAPGTIKRVRVLEGLPRHVADTASFFAQGIVIGASGAGSTRAGIPPTLPRRFLGEVPIEEDGSFNVEVPADIPIEIQLLDEHGMALRSCGWIWVKNNEPRGCIGCHEDQDLTPENRMVDAVKKPAIPLTLPPDRRRAVDFRRDIMPIAEAKCISCHGTANQLRLDGGMELVGHGGHAYFNRAYESLLAAPESWGAYPTTLGRYVHAGRARTSPLVWHLFGFNTSRPWDVRAKSSAQMKPMPPKGMSALTDDERRAFVEWIDTGALWDVPGSKERQTAHQRATGGQ